MNKIVEDKGSIEESISVKHLVGVGDVGEGDDSIQEDGTTEALLKELVIKLQEGVQ